MKIIKRSLKCNMEKTMKNIAILATLTALASISAANADKGQLSCPTTQDIKISEEGAISGLGKVNVSDTITNIQYVGNLPPYLITRNDKQISIVPKDVTVQNAVAVRSFPMWNVDPQKAYLDCAYNFNYKGYPFEVIIQPFQQTTGVTATKCTPPENTGNPNRGWYDCKGTCPTFTCE
jgi:hypothetical protein